MLIKIEEYELEERDGFLSTSYILSSETREVYVSTNAISCITPCVDDNGVEYYDIFLAPSHIYVDKETFSKIEEIINKEK